MIAAIADDFTGAAEIAGVGLRYGLEGEVQTELDPDSEAQLVVVDTDTRWRAPEEAGGEVERVTAQFVQLRPEWIYKKVDSVLRGPVLAEVEAALRALGRARVLLVPANPALGRQVRQGRYFVDGKPIDETDFANDPEYPAASSVILELLGASQAPAICVPGVTESIPATGIIIGEASNQDNLMRWAAHCDRETLPAGAAEFFAALLKSKGLCARTRSKVEDAVRQSATTLFVCTSPSPAGQKAVEEARAEGVPVAAMPNGLCRGDDLTPTLLEQWTDHTVRALEANERAIIAIGERFVRDYSRARKFGAYTAALVENVLARISVDNLCIEGGSTASAIVRRLRWKRFSPCDELAPGVVRMRVAAIPDQYLTIKPGSYRWPDKLWRLAR